MKLENLAGYFPLSDKIRHFHVAFMGTTGKTFRLTFYWCCGHNWI